MARTFTSTVPAALDALVTAFGNSPDLEDVEILDGPVITASAAEEVVWVGFTGERMTRTGVYPEADGPEAQGQATVEGLAGWPQREEYIVRCAALVRDGGGDIRAARARAFELVSAAGQAVAQDPKLGGTVMLAHMGTVSLQQAQGPKGALATVLFDVAVQAFAR